MRINGWLQGMSFVGFVKKVAKEFKNDAVTDTAAQLSYYFLFALFPFLFAVVTLAAYLPLGENVADLMMKLKAVMPGDAFKLIEEQMNALVTRERPQLLSVGVVVALWTASRGVDAFRKALNLAYDVKESRSWFKVNALAIAMTIAGALLMLLGVSFMVIGGQAGEWIAEKLHIHRAWAVAWSVLRFPLTAGAVMLASALTYYVLPDVKQKFKYITPGSVLGTLLWIGATYGFTAYVERFGRYNITYGAIGGVVVLMLWLYITGMIFIVGGEINAVLEHASQQGKNVGAKEFGEASPPAHERPSFAPVGAAKSAATAEEAPNSNVPAAAPPRRRLPALFHRWKPGHS